MFLLGHQFGYDHLRGERGERKGGVSEDCISCIHKLLQIHLITVN